MDRLRTTDGTPLQQRHAYGLLLAGLLIASISLLAGLLVVEPQQTAAANTHTTSALPDHALIPQTIIDTDTTWHRALPTVGELADVDCLPRSLCVAVSHSGAVLLSTDNGQSWSIRFSGTSTPLTSVSCTSTSACVAVGAHGTILVSSDGGQSWTDRSFDTTAYLSAVQCLDASTCVAVGSQGIVLVSSDGGLSWASGTSGSSAWLHGISCPTPGACVAVGEYGTILVSSDGGLSWNTVESDTLEQLYSVDCPDATICMAVGTRGTIRLSEDGGASWQHQPSGIGNHLHDIMCPDPDMCITVGTRGEIMRLSNSTEDPFWVPVPIEAPVWQPQALGVPVDLLAVDCAQFCVVLGAGGSVLFTTSQSGMNWTRAMLANGYISDIACHGDTFCIAVGEGGMVLTSQDGGASWMFQSSGVENNLLTVDCMTETTCIAGAGGTYRVWEYETNTEPILLTSNGGRTWRQVASIRSSTDISCPSATSCYVTGTRHDIWGTPNVGRGIVMYTRNGGQNWNSEGAVRPLSSIDCASETNCVAVGYEGNILKTSDGGDTWTTPDSGTDRLGDIACPTDDICVTTRNVRLSGDGGDTWRAASVERNGGSAITCPTASQCLTVGQFGLLSISEDSGNSWREQPAISRRDLYAITCLASGTCFAVGEEGTVLSTSAPVEPAALQITPIDGEVIGEGIGERGARRYEISLTRKPDAPVSVVLPVGNDIVTLTFKLDSWQIPSKIRWFMSHEAASRARRGTETGVIPHRILSSDPAYADLASVPLLYTVLRELPAVEAPPPNIERQSWVWRYPLPQGNDLTAVECVRPDLCVAVGDLFGYGPLISRDGGLTWSMGHLLPGTINTLRDVSCSSAQHCVAVGEGGSILVTTNGGRHWSDFVGSDPEWHRDIRHVSCPTADLCLSSDGRISRDGGVTWETDVGRPFLNRITCPTSDFCVGINTNRDEENIAISRDQGATWQQQTVPVAMEPDVISCPTAQTCVIVGETGPVYESERIVLRTTDGGATWEQQRITYEDDPQVPQALSCTADGTCVMLAHSDTIVTSRDFGRTWETTWTRGDDAFFPLQDVDCNEQGQCVAVAGGEAGMMLGSSDGGATWAYRSSLPIPAQMPRDTISCPTDTYCVSLSRDQEGESILISRDGGTTWERQQHELAPNNGLDCPTRETCFGVHSNMFVRSQDGGITWTETVPDSRQYTGNTNNIVECPSETMCVLLRRGQVALTRDGGRTWTLQTLTSSPTLPLTSISCPSERVCVVTSGYPDSIFNTLDGGETWVAREAPRRPSGGSAVDCPTEQTCVIGTGNNAWRSNDSGITWNEQPRDARIKPNILNIRAIDCPTEQTCFMVGDWGEIAASGNGGISWVPQPQTTDQQLMDITCTSEQRCLTVGIFGALLTNVDTPPPEPRGAAVQLSTQMFRLAAPGSSVAITFRVTNAGDEPLIEPRIDLALSERLSYRADGSTPGWEALDTLTVTQTLDRRYRLEFDTLAPGAAAEVVFVATVDPGSALGSQAQLRVEASGSNLNGITVDDADELVIRVAETHLLYLPSVALERDM